MGDFEVDKTVGAKNDQQKRKQGVEKLAEGPLFSLASNLVTIFYSVFPFCNVERFASGFIFERRADLSLGRIILVIFVVLRD